MAELFSLTREADSAAAGGSEGRPQKGLPGHKGVQTSADFALSFPLGLPAFLSPGVSFSLSQSVRTGLVFQSGHPAYLTSVHQVSLL